MSSRLRTVERSSVFGTRHEEKTCGKVGRLNDLLSSVVDETLRMVFSEVGTNVIYDYLENKSHLDREEIVEKPEIFSASLKRLLSSGAPIIEKMILKDLYSRLGLRFVEKEGYEFSDYIDELRRKVKSELKHGLPRRSVGDR